MNPELAQALTVLVYVIIGIAAALVIVWTFGTIFAARRIRKFTNDFDKKSADFDAQFKRLRRL